MGCTQHPQRWSDRSIPLTSISSFCLQLPAPAPRSRSLCPFPAGAPSSASSPLAPPAHTALMNPPGVPQPSRSSTWCHHQLSWHRACVRPGPPRPPRPPHPGPVTRTMRWRHLAGATSVPSTTSTHHSDQHHAGTGMHFRVEKSWRLSGGSIERKNVPVSSFWLGIIIVFFARKGGNFSLLYGCAPSRWPVKGPLIVVFVVLIKAFSLLFTQRRLCLCRGSVSRLSLTRQHPAEEPGACGTPTELEKVKKTPG